MIATLVQPLVQPLFRSFRARWLWSLIWAVGLALTLWFFGGLVAIGPYRPLESDFARMIACVVIFAGWAAFNLQVNLRAGQTNRAMIRDLVGPSEDEKQRGADAASAEELRQLRERLQEALALLRKKAGRRTGRAYLYQLPWYILIGPPGSGKSSALLTSGLNFPLSNAIGRDPLKGVGGTRNCDWWFTDDAILLDTAGRYTTQDSDPHQDQAAWLGFLDLLKTYRPRQPVNGAVVVMSLADLMAPDPTERLSHARAIRQRLNELYDRFGTRFPVYMLFTKVDLVPGFVEFFEGLGRPDREQVWGVTYPLDDGSTDDGSTGTTGVVGLFPEALEGLIARLNGQLLERMQQEADIERRSLVYGFPNQLASLADGMLEILNEIFRATPYEPRPLLRGTYLTSSVQVGTPIDRTMAAITAAFGLDPVSLPAHNRQGRSYFLTRLFRQVIFAEAAVVSLNPRAERRQRRIRIATYAIAGTILAVLAYAWTTGYEANRRQVAQINAELANYEKAVAGIPVTDVADDDLPRVVPPLDILRALPTGLHNTEGVASHWLTFGLYQGNKLLALHREVYRRALNGLLLPRLLVRLQNQIRAHQKDDDYVTAALKVYLILGGQGPFEPDAVRRWMAADWAATWPGDANKTLRGDLGRHLDALLAGPIATIPLDANLIADSRRSLAKLSPAARVYAMVREQEAADQLAQWRPVDHAGATAGRIFTRASGKALTDGIPGLYTYQGFYDGFLPALSKVIAEVQGQSWILGDKATGAGHGDVLREAVLQLYFADYTARWDGMLNDLRIVPLGDMQQTVGWLNLASSPDMPLLKLLKSIAAETRIGTAPAHQTAPAGAASVAAHFQPIADFVTPQHGAPAPVDDLIRTLGQAYQELSSVASAPAGGQAILLKRASEGVGADPVQQLATEAPQLPQPVSGWIAGIASSVSTVSVGGARAQLSDIWGGSAGSFCARAINGRYPFYKNGKRDVSVEDFARLFAPDGLLDSFFASHLRPLVDTSGRQWKWQKVNNGDLGIPDGVLAEFQRAAQIRDAFFPDGGKTPHVAFQVTPVTLDPKATGVLFATSGQQTQYQHGPQWPSNFQWPGQDATGTSKIVFEVADGTPPTIMETGTWSLFHLIDEGKVTRTGSDDFRVAFDAGGHSATYDVRSMSALNPLILNELRSFRCPASF